MDSVKSNVQVEQSGPSIVYVAGQAALLLLLLVGDVPVVGGAIETLLGPGLVAAGIGAIAKGVIDLGAGNLTPFAAPVEGNELKTTGAFSYVRHPIYGGLLVAAAGLGRCINQIVAVRPNHDLTPSTRRRELDGVSTARGWARRASRCGAPARAVDAATEEGRVRHRRLAAAVAIAPLVPRARLSSRARRSCRGRAAAVGASPRRSCGLSARFSDRGRILAEKGLGEELSCPTQVLGRDRELPAFARSSCSTCCLTRRAT